jgi:hypothetical protein
LKIQDPIVEIQDPNFERILKLKVRALKIQGPNQDPSLEKLKARALNLESQEPSLENSKFRALNIQGPTLFNVRALKIQSPNLQSQGPSLQIQGPSLENSRSET